MNMERLTAKQAAEMAKEKELTTDQALECIKQNAGYGQRYWMQMYLSDEVTIDLINLGYVVSKHVDPFGVEQTKIKW